MSKSLNIFMIAGEPSGDALGASLMRGLKLKAPDMAFHGIGGAAMEREGLESLLPMEELSVMGFAEVLFQLPRLYKLGMGLVEEIEKRQPDILVTIDLPGFNNRIAEKLKKRGTFKGKIIHYVAPSVWAWKPGRAKKIAGFLDGLMCLLPFEPEYFNMHGLKAAYVGHPLIELDRAAMDGAAFRAKMNIPANAPCIGLMLGSRQREVKHMSQKMLEALEIIYEQHRDIHVIAPTLPHLEFDVQEVIAQASMPIHVVTHFEYKMPAFAACDTAMAVSGTVGLELAYMHVPHLIVYEMNPLTALLAKFLVKTKYAHLANILLDRPAVPEFIQLQYTVDKVAKAMLRLLRSAEQREAQIEAFKALDTKMRLEGGALPSEKAAEFVLSAAADKAAAA